MGTNDSTQLTEALRHLKHALACVHIFEVIDGKTGEGCPDCEEATHFLEQYEIVKTEEEEEDEEDNSSHWWIAFGG